MNNQKIQQRNGLDRRKNPDRRIRLDRRMNGFQASARNDRILNTQEACNYLQISRPTYLKYIATGEIKAKKIGRGWRVFKSELDSLLRRY